MSTNFLLVKHLVVAKHSGPCLVKHFLSSNQKVFNPLTEESNIKVST